MDFIDSAVTEAEDDCRGGCSGVRIFVCIKALDEAGDGEAEAGKECHVGEFAYCAVRETEGGGPAKREFI